MRNPSGKISRRAALPSAALVACALLSVELLTSCGGKEEGGATGGTAGRDGGSGTTSSTAGFGGYGGHTAGCLSGNWQCCYGQPCGGSSGFGGSADGSAGTDGSPGGGGFGFGGHTSGCIGQCGGACPPCFDAGGDAADAAVDAHARAEPSQKTMAAEVIGTQACYTLSGYEADPCLPAEDSVLSWLGGLPTGCEPHISGGPFAGTAARSCCYSIACNEPAFGAPESAP